MASHVIITGATGFIGAAILTDLLARGRKVTALLRPESNLARLNSLRGFDVVRYSRLLDGPTIDALKQKRADVFIHCGWRGVGGTDRNEAFQVTQNVPFTLDTVELAAACGCVQWIGLGSQAEYGNQNCRLDENAHLRPTTIYGKAKLATGVAALALCDARNLAGVWFRIFSTYGPNDAPNWFIPYVIRQFLTGATPQLTGCEQMWDYLYVTDAARAVIAAVDSAMSGVFNLGSGSVHPLRDYVELIRKELASTAEPAYGAVAYRSDQVMHLEADVSRLQKVTGWSPQVTMAAGIKATVAFEKARNQAR